MGPLSSMLGILSALVTPARQIAEMWLAVATTYPATACVPWHERRRTPVALLWK
jgi:hypothetical protein